MVGDNAALTLAAYGDGFENWGLVNHFSSITGTIRFLGLDITELAE